MKHIEDIALFFHRLVGFLKPEEYSEFTQKDLHRGWIVVLRRRRCNEKYRNGIALSRMRQKNEMFLCYNLFIYSPNVHWNNYHLYCSSGQQPSTKHSNIAIAINFWGCGRDFAWDVER